MADMMHLRGCLQQEPSMTIAYSMTSMLLSEYVGRQTRTQVMQPIHAGSTGMNVAG
jgi:hypothetical protein